MSNLNALASRLHRRIAGVDFAISIDVTDETGTITITGPHGARPGRKVNARALLARLSRVMAAAHPGATISVLTPDTGDRFDLAAPGGAFDDRPVMDRFVVAQDEISPSADARILAPSTRLVAPCRALMICGAGNLQIRTAGTPGEFQPAFPVPQGLTLPIRALEIGPATTASPIIALF
jgi:hypothetical protein